MGYQFSISSYGCPYFNRRKRKKDTCLSWIANMIDQFLESDDMPNLISALKSTYLFSKTTVDPRHIFVSLYVPCVHTYRTYLHPYVWLFLRRHNRAMYTYTTATGLWWRFQFKWKWLLFQPRIVAVSSLMRRTPFDITAPFSPFLPSFCLLLNPTRFKKIDKRLELRSVSYPDRTFHAIRVTKMRGWNNFVLFRNVDRRISRLQNWQMFGRVWLRDTRTERNSVFTVQIKL